MRALNGKESTGTGQRRGTIMLSWISREFLRAGGRHRGYPMGSLLTDYNTLRFVPNHEISAREVFFTTSFHPLVTLMHLRVKKWHFIQFCRPPKKCRSALLYAGARSTQCIIQTEAERRRREARVMQSIWIENAGPVCIFVCTGCVISSDTLLMNF